MSFRRFLYASRFPAERGSACFPMGIRPRRRAENAQAGAKKPARQWSKKRHARRGRQRTSKWGRNPPDNGATNRHARRGRQRTPKRGRNPPGNGAKNGTSGAGDKERPSGDAGSREKAKNDDAWRKTARVLPGARRENAIHLTEDAGMTVDRHGKHGMTTKRRGKITDAKHKNVPGAGIFTKKPKR